MEISRHGVEAIKKLEGFRERMYLDSAGLPTIGVGHLLTRSELTSGKVDTGKRIVKWAGGLSVEDVEDLLKKDLAGAEAVVSNWSLDRLNQHQFDALVCFAFNVGASAFVNSTLRKRVNSGLLSDVPNQLRRWVHSGGKVVQGLINRREAEIRMWNGEYP